MPEKPLKEQAQDNAIFQYTQQVIFIRHGESDAHVGKAATHIEEVGLTSPGEKKAQEIAATFPHTPDLIIVSPYLRAWQTALPTIERFPDTPYTIWPEVREFTYLGSLAGKCTTRLERSEKVTRFWENAKPEDLDHEDLDRNGESFVQFVERARYALDRLRRMEGLIVIFTHEQFIRLIQCLLLEWDDPEVTKERMIRFRTILLDSPLSYGYTDGESWQQHMCRGTIASPLSVALSLKPLPVGR